VLRPGRVSKPLAALDKHAAVGQIARDGGDALVAEWATGKVLRVALSGGRVTTFPAGLRNPLAVAARAGVYCFASTAK
jgi:hypothetical protein